MKIETERLVISRLEIGMAQALHELSLDEDNRRFVPDEVFETREEAADTIRFLLSCYEHGEGPLVYAVSLKDGSLAGYVQAVPLKEGKWEIGYHIGKKYTRRGFAAEALQAFLPEIFQKLGLSEITGVCLKDNIASIRVLEKCGFEKQFEGLGDYQGKEKEICVFTYKK